MRPEDDSCMNKVKEIYPRLKFYHLTDRNVQEIQKKTNIMDRFSNLFLNAKCETSVLCLLCFVRVCLYVLCGHLLGKG